MKKINLLDEDIYKLFIKIALPASIGTIFNNLYSLVDTIFAGRMISETALAAIGQTFPVYFIIIALGIGLSIATTSNVANSLGEKNIKKASHAFSQSFVVTILVGLGITIFGLYFGNIILESINDDPKTLNLSSLYMNVIYLGSVIILLLMVCNSCLSAQGDTKSYRNVLIFTFFLNIFLNPLFIFGYGFVPAFGIAGLAIATVVAQFTGLLYLAHKVYCCELKQFLKLECFIPKFNLLGELVYQTLPVMFSMLLIGVGLFNILYFIGQFGDLATAGYGAALRIEQVFLLPVIGLNTAVLSIGGQNFGAKNYDRLRELYKKALLFGSSFMICAGIIIFIGAEFLVSLFTDNSEAVKHGAIYLKVAALIGPIYPVFFITTAVFQAVKKPLYSLYMSVLRLTALPFFSLWYVINIRGGDYEDIFYTIFVTNWLMGIAVLMFIGYFLNNVFKQNKNLFTN